MRSCPALLLVLLVPAGAGCAARLPAVLPPELPPASERLYRWERVLALAPGTRVRIELGSGVVIRGRFECADDEKVVTIEGGSLRAVSRSAVETVDMVTRRVGDFTLRGLAVGALAGTAISIYAAGSSDPLPVLFMVPWAGGIGASAGALLGLTPLESVVYEARPPDATTAPARRPNQDERRGTPTCTEF